jgi:hypothetical protein
VFCGDYTDTARGHTGTIYQAANFQHLGRAGDEWHAVDRNGKRMGISTAEARERLGLRPQRMKGRDRWFLDLSPNR